jgi:two-component system response regulator HydG
VGDNRPIKVNVRLISATNRPLEAMIEDGSFRNDLFYRLKVVTVHLPPLRERRDDIIPLMDHFRKTFVRKHNHAPCNFTTSVTKKFFSYDWPGNIRQLRNFVETMVVLDMDGKLDVDDLPPELSDGDGPNQSEIDTAISHAQPSSLSSLIGVTPSDLIGKSMDEIERWAIEETLKITAGNRDEAAKILGIGARTLYRKLDKYKSDG